MKQAYALLFTLAAATTACASPIQPGRVTLFCHRTANQDVPENTLESLEEAALLGCNVVEIDLRRTLDGKIVLNHDGLLERLTDGTGNVETTYYDDLRLSDAGSWMGERFAGLHIALFDDALRLAREKDIQLILDIKTKGIGVQVLEALQREGMLQRVQFNGEWDDVKKLYPPANEDRKTAWVQPGVTAEEVASYHLEGKAVVANFSDNSHTMDLAGMKAAVSAGVDGINVDYPRLGADAVGRPVEQKIQALTARASTGENAARSSAIHELSHYRGIPLADHFAHWLLDPDAQVSRAASVALVTARPRTQEKVFASALLSSHADARANAAWALGVLEAPAASLLPLLRDTDPQVLQETLLSLSRMPGEVSAAELLPLLSNGKPGVRGTAALALAKHQPAAALKAIPMQLRLEMKAALRLNDEYVRRGKPQLTPSEIEEITGCYRSQMKMVQAISMLRGPDAMLLLEEQAFYHGGDFVQMNGLVAGFQLWDRIGDDPLPAVQALASTDILVANRAEWILVQAGPAVLPEVRKALSSSNSEVRSRAMRIVAWQGDTMSLPALETMPATDAALASWAIKKIKSLHPEG